MAVKVIIPTPLRPYTGKQESVELQAGTVGEALSALTSKFGELKKHLFADDGRLRSFVNVYVNDEDVRYLQNDQTKLKEGDTVSIVPSIAGGACF
jgi:MoaD family protein